MDSELWNLDVLAQQPRINRLYTQLTFCFDVRNSQHSDFRNVLESACQTLPNSFPWAAGNVVYRDGTFKIRRSAKAIPLTIKESQSGYSEKFYTLLSSEFPFNMLDESRLTPCQTLATSDATTAELVVFAIQANFVEGGVLLTFAGQHGAMDMTGLGQLIYLFSKACRNEPFTQTELSIGNMDRSEALAGLERANIEEYRTRQTSSVSTSQNRPKMPTQIAPSKLVWAYFAFSNLALASLKSLASNGLPKGSFVSTDDALTAFVWLSMTRARTKGQTTPPIVSTTLSRNVDMRRYLSLPPTYPGLITESTTHPIPVVELLRKSVSQVALQLRAALDRPTLVRQFTSQIARIVHPDKRVPPKREVPELEVRLSSWSKNRCYDLDFGFGKPVCVRRPAFYEGTREGLVYLLPKSLDGEIAVGICLGEDDMETLRNESDFTCYGKYLG